jgi:hypothetical protein
MRAVRLHARRCLSLLAVAAAGCAVLPADAGAADDLASAFVWAYDPTAAAYTPVGPYTFNSTGQSNAITREGVGRYVVTFPGVGDTTAFPGGGGTVDVTAYGPGTSACEVQYWSRSDTTISVHAVCTDTDGRPVDSRFDVAYTSVRRFLFTSGYGYVWANQPTSSSYAAEPTYRYSNGASDLRSPDVARVTRSGTGRYQVRLQGIGLSTGGTAKVTAYGGLGNRCKVGSWYGAGAFPWDLLVNVSCFTAFGSPVDSRYTLTYANHSGLLLSGGRYAYAWANEPSSPQYVPATTWSWPSDSTTQITRSGVGSYAVHVQAGTDLPSDVQVSAYGSDSNECRVDLWVPDGTGQTLYVRCYTTAGLPADSLFTVQFFGP